MEISLDGDGARGRVISRSVAKGTSRQVFYPKMVGNAACFGHVQCDSIIMDDAHIESIPAIVANSTEAQLIHEAAIGKIAGDQLLKLETLGLSPEEAEAVSYTHLDVYKRQPLKTGHFLPKVRNNSPFSNNCSIVADWFT